MRATRCRDSGQKANGLGPEGIGAKAVLMPQVSHQPPPRHYCHGTDTKLTIRYAAKGGRTVGRDWGRSGQMAPLSPTIAGPTTPACNPNGG